LLHEVFNVGVKKFQGYLTMTSGNNLMQQL